MSSYVIPLFPAAAASPLPTRDAVAAELSRLRDRVDAGLPGKADKAPPSAAGNLASLDAAGNLSDSGATPASIKAAAVAEVVANAPGTMDTLKEIADILGSSQQTGTVLKRILDLESGKVDKEAGKGLVAVDAALAAPGAAADAKAVGDALRGGFTEWEFSGVPGGVGGYYLYWNPSEEAWIFFYYAEGQQNLQSVDAPGGEDALRTTFSVEGAAVTAARHLVTPTKTSQLTNDSGFLTSHQDVSGKAPLASPAFTGVPTAPTAASGTSTTQVATTAFVQGAVSGKADRVSGATSGNLASLTATGNLADSGAKASDFATPSDLPYRLAEPGKWEFSGSGVQSGKEYYVEYESLSTEWTLYVSTGLDEPPWGALAVAQGTANDLAVVFLEGNVTATRASLPGHLLDRAGNRVVVTGDTTLTLPAANPGYLRDFLVRLEISGSTVPTITFAAPTGETITYETYGDEFPVPDEAGTWSYSFTENCVSHKFAVALKKVNEVAQAAQGGS